MPTRDAKHNLAWGKQRTQLAPLLCIARESPPPCFLTTGSSSPEDGTWPLSFPDPRIRRLPRQTAQSQAAETKLSFWFLADYHLLPPTQLAPLGFRDDLCPGKNGCCFALVVAVIVAVVLNPPETRVLAFSSCIM